MLTFLYPGPPSRWPAADSFYQYAAGESYLIAETEAFYDPTYRYAKILRYDGSPLKEVCSPINLGRCTLSKIRGRDLYFDTFPGNGAMSGKRYRQTWRSLNRVRFRYRLHSSGHRIKLYSGYGKVVSPYSYVYRGKTFRLSSCARSANRKGMAVKNGCRYTLKRIYVSKNRFMLYLTRKGQGGWINSYGHPDARYPSGRFVTWSSRNLE